MQSLWIGDELSVMETLSIASFLFNGYEYHLYVYKEPKGVPEGTTLKDANEIISEQDVFAYCNGSYAGFADWFRWELLYKKGNYWLDTDEVCLKPFTFREDVVFGLQSEELAAVGVVKVPAGNEMCRFLANSCKFPNKFLPYDTFKIKKMKFLRKLSKKNKREDIKWGETGGPDGVTKALKHFDLFNSGKPASFFYPIHHHNWKSIFDETFKDGFESLSNSYALHLWNEMTRREPGFDKNGSFPKLSLYEQLKAKYL